MFREPRSAAHVDAVLSEFSTAARGAGAAIVCVVGAKLSEGLNFKDDLARCVVVVGLPYPDASDAELRQRMAHLDAAAREERQHPRPASGGGAAAAAPQSAAAAAEAFDAAAAGAAVSSETAGRRYYHSLCFRAVNQSIGRSIRHAGDYASILLVDRRYKNDAAVAARLPQWVGSQLKRPATFGELVVALRTFYRVMAQPAVVGAEPAAAAVEVEQAAEAEGEAAAAPPRPRTTPPPPPPPPPVPAAACRGAEEGCCGGAAPLAPQPRTYGRRH